MQKNNIHLHHIHDDNIHDSVSDEIIFRKISHAQLNYFLRRPTLRPTLDPSQTVVLNRGHGYSNRYNSAEGVLFTHK